MPVARSRAPCPMPASLADDRREYAQRTLRAADLHPDPFVQFGQWMNDARAAGVPEPTAMTLATATPEGHPSARIVLLKGVDADGFVFFTNYESRKGHELAQNPWAALVFWWNVLERQIRIEGRVTRLTPAESDVYHRRRPRGSQLGAWASPQSRVIAGRDVLDSNLAAAEARYADADVPRPPHWGGFRLAPVALEFWQGRPSRLHDRFRYHRAAVDAPWQCERLAP